MGGGKEGGRIVRTVVPATNESVRTVLNHLNCLYYLVSLITYYQVMKMAFKMAFKKESIKYKCRGSEMSHSDTTRKQRQGIYYVRII